MAKSLPRRPRSHVLETISRQHVEGIFPPEWVCRRVEDDYGLDMRIEIVVGEEVTGLEFLVQLRATDNLKTSGDDVLHRCDVSTAQYFLRCPEPVMYVVYDAQVKVAYWLWVQPYLRRLDETCAGWRDHKSVQIRIPCINLLTPESTSAIADNVRAWNEVRQVFLKGPEKPPPGKETNVQPLPAPGLSHRAYALNLLKCLLKSEFGEVVFRYGMPRTHLPNNVSQVQKAIEVIEYAVQREGDSIPELLSAIYSVAPHLQEDVDGSSDRTP
jgi:hypothetical protein